jgi:glucose-6-phosphate isomerase
MVVLPYKDRLLLLSRYLQQLVMESIGKEKDLTGRVVHQGLTVYGNKGSTDQHAFVQQLRDGTPDFFVSFVRVLREREGPSLEVEPGATSGDFLDGLQLGTRRALQEGGRPSLTITVEKLDPRSLGMLIALYERAVGLYAGLVGINAYHQPGVEAGKRAAAFVLELQRKVVAALRERGAAGATCDELAAAAGAPDEVETVFHLLERLAANPERGVAKRPGATPWGARYSSAPRPPDR